MNRIGTICLSLLGLVVAMSAVSIAAAAEHERPPNILVIMGSGSHAVLSEYIKQAVPQAASTQGQGFKG